MDIVSRKPGETNETSHRKYRGVPVRRSIGLDNNGWESVMKSSHCKFSSDQYKRPKKWGVMEGQLGEYKPGKKFIATTSNKSALTITNEITAQAYEKPLVQAPSEIAMAKGLPIGTKKKKAETWIPKKLLAEERKRQDKLTKPPMIQSPMSRVNMPNYTGHEPQSPKNARGPFCSGVDTTSGRANVQGLGVMLS